MERHFVDTAKAFVYYPYLKKAKSAPAHYVHGTVARQVDGIFIAQLNCPRTSTVLPLKTEWGYGRILVRDGANAGWINYMLKDRQKSEFDGFVDCIVIESLHNRVLQRQQERRKDTSRKAT
jgi:hypothetical protein